MRIRKDEEDYLLENIHWISGVRELISISALNNQRIRRLLLTYDPIWKDDRFQRDVSRILAERVRKLSKADVAEWRGNLTAVGGGGITDLWSIAIMVDIDRLFAQDKFNTVESDILLRRMRALPHSAIAEVANVLKVGKAKAAVLIVQNDLLFEDNSFQRVSFDQEMEMLKAAVAGGRKLQSTALPR